MVDRMAVQPKRRGGPHRAVEGGRADALCGPITFAHAFLDHAPVRVVAGRFPQDVAVRERPAQVSRIQWQSVAIRLESQARVGP
jgi:hypothetical protein